MKSFSAIILFSLISFTFAGEDDVLDLTDSDFSSRVGETETTLVMFYAPWCGHCKRLKPEYARAAELLKGDDTPIALAKVDCTEGGKDTCNKFSVSGYPTLKIFRNGELSSDYGGPREANGIVKYMRSQVGPSSKSLETVEDFKKFIEKDDTAVVGFFEEESELKAAFISLADKLREKVRFGHSSNAKVLKENKQKDAIVLYRPKQMANKFEDSFVVYSGAADSTDLNDFIKKEYHGLVGHRTRDSSPDFKNPLVIGFYTVDYVKNAKGTNYWRNRILKVAKDFSKDFTFAISSKDEFTHEMNEFGIEFSKEEKPVIVAYDDNSRKYVMSEEFSIDNLASFLKKLKDGDLTPYLKSEPIPDSNDGPVTVAVAKNFDEVVVDNGKDTLIEFYAPWCGHCKKLTPIFDELGELMKGEDVSIVKMDATANDVPAPFQVRGYPTLFWLAKGNKKSPVNYEGGRELDDFVKYISKHASSELKKYDRKGNAKKEEL